MLLIPSLQTHLTNQWLFCLFLVLYPRHFLLILLFRVRFSLFSSPSIMKGQFCFVEVRSQNSPKKTHTHNQLTIFFPFALPEHQNLYFVFFCFHFRGYFWYKLFSQQQILLSENWTKVKHFFSLSPRVGLSAKLSLFFWWMRWQYAVSSSGKKTRRRRKPQTELRTEAGSAVNRGSDGVRATCIILRSRMNSNRQEKLSSRYIIKEA